MEACGHDHMLCVNMWLCMSLCVHVQAYVCVGV